MARPKSKSTKSKKAAADPKIPYHRKPSNLSLEEWQVALRSQFAKEQNYRLTKLTGDSVFGDYTVFNPQAGSSYKVAIRGDEIGKNFCNCLDFKTNQLGTCKHIEFALHTLRSKRGMKKILKQGYNPHYTSIYLSYGEQKEVKIRIGYEEEKAFKKFAASYFDKNNVLLPDAIDHIHEMLSEGHRIHPDFRYYPDALEFMLDQRERKERNSYLNKLLKDKETFFTSLTNAKLFPYQQEGVEFILRSGRCLLADDMGLGKTLQAIVAAEAFKKHFNISSVLIVCPTSLKYQWKSEIERFTESDVQVIEGSMFKRESQYTADPFYKICTYNVVGRDLKYINAAEFDLVILDEAQRIKNWKTKTAASVKKVQSQFCIVLTGTPLENKLEELYSVMQMVDPQYLGALFRFLQAHQILDPETERIIGYKDLDKINVLLKDVLLRRHKSMVLKQLPARMDKNLFVPMTPKQIEYYNDAYEIVRRIASKWAKYHFLSEKDRQRLLINLNIMRMACDSTYILDETTRHDTKVDELLNILDEAFANGVEKVVVFSQWERMTRIIGWELQARNIGFESLHGGVPSVERGKLFDNFKNNPDSKVFLSTDAGGVGLNLQSASLLVNMDLPWNPAVLEQRIARIYRMGQKKNVQIINLIAGMTIETQMLDKLAFKSSLAAGILDAGESSVFMKTSKLEDLMNDVDQLIQNNPQPQSEEDTDREERLTEAIDAEEISAGMKHDDVPVKEDIIVEQLTLFEEEAVSEEDIQQESPEVVSDAETLISTGAGFLGSLIETLSDTKKTEKLISTLVQKDDKTGETYLKIPVKNQAIIENGLKLLGQLLGGR